MLQTEDGRAIDVDKVEKREGQFKVYNFQVEGFHTYFVSDLSILVHNAEYPSSFGGFGNEEVFLRKVSTSRDPLEIAAEVGIDGKILTLKSISIFPKDVRRFELSPREITNLKNQLAQEAKGAGFERLKITGKRVSGANLGKNVDIDIDLTKL